MGRELEVKLEVAPGTELDDGGPTALDELVGVAGVATAVADEVRRLDAEYWDTSGRSLLHAGATLRRRTGDAPIARWTLKIPEGGLVADGALDRAEHEVDDDAHEPPEALVARAAALADGELAPLARLVTERRTVRLLDGDGRSLVEVADDRVDATVDGGGTASWRELEAEVVDGDAAVLDAVVGVLRGAGARPAEARPKLARALDEAVGAPR